MKKKKAELTAEQIDRKIKRQIIMVIVIGIIVLVIDIVSGASGGDITVIESEGHTYLIRPERDKEAGYLYLTAEVETEEGMVDKSVSVKLDPYEEKGSANENDEAETSDEVDDKEEIGYELRKLVSSFNKDTSVRRIELPSSLENGERITWKINPQSNTMLIVVSVMVLSVIIYKNRYSPLKKQKKEQEDSVISNLPEFLNRLVLLLNAGLVLNSAFEKTIEENMLFHEGENDYFTERMNEIYISMKAANGSMHTELKRFARESGIKELIRVSNIINDNISKGVELTGKLKNENEILWVSRKRNCEERCRLAETKLTLPLMIFLIVLIVIVTAPALLEL